MVKKTSELVLPTGAEDLIAASNVIEASVETPAIENPPVSIMQIRQQAKVNTVIHEWLTDMWLLTTGEELKEDFPSNKKQSGRPLAIVCDGQMRLTESRPFAVDALRAVGIEME